MRKIKGTMEKCASEGIIRFFDLPEGNHVLIQPQFKNRLMMAFMKVVGSSYNASKKTRIGRTTIQRYFNDKEPKMKLNFLLKIVKATNAAKFDLNNIERNIKWIGGSNSQGVINPKLPFDFNSREGARFLAAICNDGWIGAGAYYSFSEQDLADSVKSDCLAIFGGDKYTVTCGEKGNDK